jgi:hypothetical protein
MNVNTNELCSDPFAAVRRKGKACDIGYALAISFYEKTNSVPACADTVLMRSPLSRSPNRSYSSQEPCWAPPNEECRLFSSC